jgi:hypothetical protein
MALPDEPLGASAAKEVADIASIAAVKANEAEDLSVDCMAIPFKKGRKIRVVYI